MDGRIVKFTHKHYKGGHAMLTKKQERMVLIVGIALIIVLSVGLVKLNLKYAQENEVADNEDIEDESIDIEEEKKEIKVPPIEPPKKDKDVELKYKEEVKEIDGNKVLVKPTPPPKEDEKLPEGMEKPKTEPKPTNPPKPVNTETADKKDNKTTKAKNSDKPPAYKEEEKPKVVNGGTGSDGVLRDLKGNPIDWPDAKPVEVNGSDLLDDGEVAGQGDKF